MSNEPESRYKIQIDGSTMSGNFVAGPVSSSALTSAPEARTPVSLADIQVKIAELNSALEPEWASPELKEAEASLSAYMDDPSEVRRREADERLRRAMPALKQIAAGAAGAAGGAIASEIYRLIELAL